MGYHLRTVEPDVGAFEEAVAKGGQVAQDADEPEGWVGKQVVGHAPLHRKGANFTTERKFAIVSGLMCLNKKVTSTS